MSQLSLRLQSLSPSATFAMSAKSAELKAAGVDVINMSVGEPDFNPPDYIKDAAKAAIDGNVTRYSPVPGYPDLRKAICNKLLRENGLTYEPAEIVVSNGAKQAITDAVMALVNPGDEVIIPAPCWVSYIQMARIAGGVPVSIEAPIEQDFKVTPEQLEAAITPKSKLIILCSPSNPTGSIYSAQELEALAKVVLRHDGLFVLSDEIYEHLNYVGRHASIAAVEGMRDRTVVVNGVSKAYAMTGWRIGFTAAPLWLSKGINMLQGHYSSGPCSVSQMAALAAWSQDWVDAPATGPATGNASAPAPAAAGNLALGPESGQRTVEAMRQAFQRRRDLIVRLAREIPGLEVNVPQGAFYLFPKCSAYFGKTVAESGRCVSEGCKCPDRSGTPLPTGGGAQESEANLGGVPGRTLRTPSPSNGPSTEPQNNAPSNGFTPDPGEWAGKTIKDSSDFAMYLLEVAHVATVGGDAFGAPDCFRMSYATSDANITEALARIKQALELLR